MVQTFVLDLYVFYISLEIVVVGTGEKILRLDPEIHKYMKKHNILLEVQDTVSFVVKDHSLKYKCVNNFGVIYFFQVK